jgi:hypothetical protein
MATTALDEIDIGGHGAALTVETKQAEAPAESASKVPLNIATKPPTVADQVTRRAALARAGQDRVATSRTVNSEGPPGTAAGRFAEAGKTIVDEHRGSVEQVLDRAKALVALVRLLARVAAREAWDDGQARRRDPVDAPGDADIIPTVLGHGSPKTAEKHYNLPGSREASGDHGRLIDDLRQRLSWQPGRRSASFWR